LLLFLFKYRNLLELAKQLGADECVLINEKFFSIDNENDHKQRQNIPISIRYDIVFDTTGTSSGFELALKLSKRGT
jgi:threonine dehydrogenase-like Zn-dependent dehydrogenase